MKGPQQAWGLRVALALGPSQLGACQVAAQQIEAGDAAEGYGERQRE